MPKRQGRRKVRGKARGRAPQGDVSGGGATTAVWNTNSQHFPRASRLLHSDNVPHHVWQTAELGNLSTSSAGGEVDGAQSFNINQIQGISSWLSVFDQYKIEQIEVWMTLSGSGTTNSDNYRLLTVVDYDDDSALTFNALLQYSNVTDSGRFEGVYRRFKPHVATGVNSGGSNVLAKNEPAGWLDSGTPTVKHFGVKWAHSATSTTVVLAMRIRFHIMFRNDI